MRTIHLDGSEMTTREALHRRLAEEFHFPPWYGRNLDALYDLLTEPGEETLIVLEHREALEDWSYGQAFLAVLNDAAEANPCIRLDD